MSKPASSLPATPHEKRYRSILRDTIRRELESRLNEHLVEDDNLQHYLEHLDIPHEISPLRNSFDCAMSAVRNCKPINLWFDLDYFWNDLQASFAGERGTPAYQAILAQLLIRLHGSWVFTLDDTNHTFRFIDAPSPRDEWGNGKNPDDPITEWEEVRIHFGTGVHYKPGKDDNLRKILGKALDEYLLRPGEGSVGLGLRADRGVCLRDTVRDLRGAVALEDCLTRNLSYIGLPIFLKESRPQELGDRGRPIGHFGLFFPAPLGWHKPLTNANEWCEHCTFPCDDANDEKQKDPICLYQRVLDLRKKFIQPLVAQNYETLSNQRYKSRVEQIAQLGENPIFQSRGVDPRLRREEFLKKLLPWWDVSGSGDGSGTLRIDDFQSVQIWEKHSAVAGLSEGAASSAKEKTTWRQSVRWFFPELFLAQLRQTATHFRAVPERPDSGPWDEVSNGPWRSLVKEGFYVSSKPLGGKHRILVVSKGSQANPDVYQAAVTCWERVLKLIENTNPPDSLAEFRERRENTQNRSEPPEDVAKKINSANALDRVVMSQKWKRLLRNHVAQCLVARLLGREAIISSVLFELDPAVVSEVNERLKAVPAIEQALLISIIGGADYRLDDNKEDSSEAKGKFAPLEERLRFELKNGNHTVPVFLGLANAAREADLLTKQGDSVTFRVNHGKSPHADGNEYDWPIQSEAYFDSQGTRFHVDCGAETAFSIPAIWRAWCKEFPAEEQRGLCSDLLPPDTILLERVADSRIRVTLYHAKDAQREHTLTFFLVHNQTPCVAFHRVLAHDAEKLKAEMSDKRNAASRLCETPDSAEKSGADYQLWKWNERGHEATCCAANKVADFLQRSLAAQKNPSKGSDNTASFVLLAEVGGKWMLKSQTFSGEVVASKQREVIADDNWKPFQDVVSSSGADSHPLGPDFGLTSHIFVPLRRAAENDSGGVDVGFMVLSGSQIENDTIRRVDVRPAQRALAQFAADYLEYAISQELQTLDMQESLQGFAHSLRRRGEFLRFGSFSSFVTGIEDLLQRQSIACFDRFRDILVTALPDHSRVFYHLANLVTATKTLETLRPANADFNILIEALTKVLAGKPELPFPSEVADTLQHLNSLESWFYHIASAAYTLEEGRTEECKFVPKLPTTVNVPIDKAPLGSWAVIVEEVIRNAAKHGAPAHKRILTIDITETRIRLECENKRRRKISGAAQRDSTGSGRREMRKHLRINYGEESDVTWRLTETEEDPYVISIVAFHDAYLEQIRTVYEDDHSLY